MLFDHAFQDSHAAAYSTELKNRLDALAGSWRGAFKVFAPDGSLIRRVEMEQSYHWNGSILIGRIAECDAQHVKTESIARIMENHEGLVCEVTSQLGETTVQHGRWEEPNLFWHRRDRARGVVECIKECVTQGKQRLMLVDGFANYGGVQYLFEGRYREVKG